MISDGKRPHFVRDILEDLYPARYAPAPPAPKWLLNLTYDAWFGESFGPHQHLATARIRGFEEGLPVIRSANTGISFSFDPYGRELWRIGLFVRARVGEHPPRVSTSAVRVSRCALYLFMRV